LLFRRRRIQEGNIKKVLREISCEVVNPLNLVSGVANCSRKVSWYATSGPTHLQFQIETDDKVILHRCQYQSKPRCF
jgi:hypothetical protein